jgi:hypothetical protein
MTPGVTTPRYWLTQYSVASMNLQLYIDKIISVLMTDRYVMKTYGGVDI